MWYNSNMRLSKNLDQALILLVISVVLLLAGSIFTLTLQRTFAAGEEEPATLLSEYFVNIFDGSDKLTVKSKEATVAEILERSGVELSTGDIVEPALETVVNADNYFINIYRARPALVRDGDNNKYVMTASYDLKTIARAAGFEVYDGDEVKPVINTLFLELGMVEIYDIKRNGGSTITEEEEIPFSEQRVKDYNVAPGKEEVRQFGEVGVKVKTYEVHYVDGAEATRKLVSEEVKKEPVTRIVAVGASATLQTPLTKSKGRNRYTVTKANGQKVERQETYYDLNMSGVMRIAARECGVPATYSVRSDGVKVDAEGYVLVAANLSRYPRCSVVETSLGHGKVYDTGSFAAANPEQFDLATDWTRRDGV